MKKLFLLMLVIGGFITSLHSQNAKNKNMKTALLIIDIQEFYFPSEENAGLLGAEEASLVAKEVLNVLQEARPIGYPCAPPI